MKSHGSVEINKHQLAQRAAQEVDADEVVRLTQALVRIESYYPGPAEQPVVDFLEPYLRERGFKTTIQAVMPGRPNLIADLGGGPGGVMLGGGTGVGTHGQLGGGAYPP